MLESILTASVAVSLTLAIWIVTLYRERARTGSSHRRICDNYENERKHLLDRLLFKNNVAPVHQPEAPRQNVPQAYGHRSIRERQHEQRRKDLENVVQSPKSKVQGQNLSEEEKASLRAALPI